MNRFMSAACLLFSLASLGVAAQETNSVPPDKSGYNLFNPTPDQYMREISPDRPDKTESPYTLDAGHFMLEMDFANYTYNQPRHNHEGLERRAL